MRFLFTLSLVFVLNFNYLYAQTYELSDNFIESSYTVSMNDTLVSVNIKLKNVSQEMILIPISNSNYSSFIGNVMFVYVGYDHINYVNSDINYTTLESDSVFCMTLEKKYSKQNSLQALEIIQSYALKNDFSKKEIFVSDTSQYFSLLNNFLMNMKFFRLYIPMTD